MFWVVEIIGENVAASRVGFVCSVDGIEWKLSGFWRSESRRELRYAIEWTAISVAIDQ